MSDELRERVAQELELFRADVEHSVFFGSKVDLRRRSDRILALLEPAEPVAADIQGQVTWLCERCAPDLPEGRDLVFIPPCEDCGRRPLYFATRGTDDE